MRQAQDMDLPLNETPAGRLLFGITAGLVYLAVLAMAVAALADGQLRSLVKQPHLVTIVLPAANPDDRTAAEAQNRLLDMLRQFSGVAHAGLVDGAEMATLVAPLVGDDPAVAELAMPQVIDVTFNPGPMPDLDALRTRVQAFHADATVMPVDESTHDLEASIRLYRSAGLAIGAAMLLVTIISVVVVTRLSLDMHTEIVDLLRMMGASNAYVARQFEAFALSQGMRGALYGFVGGCLTLLAIVHLLPLISAIAFPALKARPIDWLFLALVPIVAALLITLSARLTAMWGLFSER